MKVNKVMKRFWKQMKKHWKIPHHIFCLWFDGLLSGLTPPACRFTMSVICHLSFNNMKTIYVIAFLLSSSKMQVSLSVLSFRLHVIMSHRAIAPAMNMSSSCPGYLCFCSNWSSSETSLFMKIISELILLMRFIFWYKVASFFQRITMKGL